MTVNSLLLTKTRPRAAFHLPDLLTGYGINCEKSSIAA